MYTFLGKLVAYKEEVGGYIIYVFKKIDYKNEYEMCTRLPNWNTDTLKIGDIGYVSIKPIIAGEDTWYDHTLNKKILYKYDGNYFINFIKHMKTKDKLIL